MGNEPCASYQTFLPIWLCECITGPRRLSLAYWPNGVFPKHALGHTSCPFIPDASCKVLSASSFPSVGPSAAFFLTIFVLAFVTRQYKHPKIKVRGRWWTVEVLLATNLFVMTLFLSAGFWYARCALVGSVVSRSPFRLKNNRQGTSFLSAHQLPELHSPPSLPPPSTAGRWHYLWGFGICWGLWTSGPSRRRLLLRCVSASRGTFRPQFRKATVI